MKMRKIRTIIVDDEKLQGLAVQDLCLCYEDIEVTGIFTDASQAEFFAQENVLDLALLDIEMPGINGIELGRRLEARHPGILLIYLTAYEEYAMEAYRLQAVSYLLKPVLRKDFQEAVSRIRKLLPEVQPHIRIQTFSNFNIYVDDKCIVFPYQKAKELLALMVDARGGQVTEEKVIACLWEDRCYDQKAKALYRKTVMELRKVLVNEGIQELCTFEYGRCRVNPDTFACDYYDLLKQPGGNYDMYMRMGYLNEYSWSEMSRGYVQGVL